jgi:hypothetical protein
MTDTAAESLLDLVATSQERIEDAAGWIEQLRTALTVFA